MKGDIGISAGSLASPNEPTTAEKSASRTVKDALKSPRIVKKAPDGTWQEVQPYPLTPKWTTATEQNISTKPGDPSPTGSPRRVNKNEMSKEKRTEYDMLLLRKTKEKAESEELKLREKAAEGSLSPREVELAVGMAAEVIWRGDKQSKIPAESEMQVRGEGLEGAIEKLDMLRKQRERLKMKVANGDLSKEESQHAMRKLEVEIQRVKGGYKGVRLDRQEGEGFSNEGGKKPSSDNPDEEERLDIKKPSSPSNDTDLKRKLAEIEERERSIQEKVKEGRLRKDEGRTELMRLAQKKQALREARGAHVDAFDRDRKDPISIVPRDGTEGAKKVEMMIQRVKRKVKDGSMSKEEGEKEVKRLVKDREASVSIALDREAGAGSAAQNQVGQATTSPKKPCDEMKDGITTSASVKRTVNLGQAAENPKRPADVPTGLVSNSTRQAATRDEESAAITHAKPGEAEIAGIEAQILRIKRKVKEGSMKKEDAKREMSRLTQIKGELKSQHSAQPSKTVADNGEHINTTKAVHSSPELPVQDHLLGEKGHKASEDKVSIVQVCFQRST